MDTSPRMLRRSPPGALWSIGGNRMTPHLLARKHLLVGAIVAIFAAAGFAQSTTPRPGTTVPGANGEMRLGGQTEPAARVEVPASVHGILSEVNVKEGQVVKKGEQLARLDDALQQTKVEYERVGAEGTADLRDAQNQVEFAEKELEQINRLQSPPKTEQQQKELALKRAKLSVEVAIDKQKL